ncbi:MAG: class IV adenylate cyclase [Muricoprocola sp.]
MIEVEVKLPVSDWKIIEDKLQQFGFEAGDLVEERDVYFTSDVYDFKQADKALRIRKTKNIRTGKIQAFLTYKGTRMDEISMTREELETEVEDGDVGERILKSIGFREVSPVRKLRRYYFLNELTVCVDQVDGLGDFLEAEIIVSSETERESALQKIQDFLEKMGHSMEETTRISYLSMLQEK